MALHIFYPAYLITHLLTGAALLVWAQSIILDKWGEGRAGGWNLIEVVVICVVAVVISWHLGGAVIDLGWC